MKKKSNGDVFATTNSLKILSFLSEHPGREFLGSEIQKATSISRAGIYIALQDLTRQRLVHKACKGKFLMYSAVYDEPLLKQFKVMRTIQLLKPVIERIKPFAKKIVLYGSASRGEDEAGSDIDLFIVAAEPEETKKTMKRVHIRRKIEAVIKSPSELADFRDREKVYYDEVERGITLWEAQR